MDVYFTQIVTKSDQTVSQDITHCVRAGITHRYGAGNWGLPGGEKQQPPEQHV